MKISDALDGAITQMLSQREAATEADHDRDSRELGDDLRKGR